jgi:hypothetical protein
MRDAHDLPAEPLPAAAPPVLGYQAPRSSKTARVATCADAGEGQVLVGELAGYGIPAAIINEHTSALGPWGGNAVVKVEVPLEDADRAAEIVNRLRSGDDLEPEDEPPEGRVDAPTDEHGQPQPLAVVAEYDTAREMYDCAATLGSARVAPFMPNVVRRPEGAAPSRRKFVVRVPEEDLERARRVLADAKAESEDDDDPRCPACGSWHVGRRVEGLFATVARWLVGGRDGEPDPPGQWQCYRCRAKF